MNLLEGINEILNNYDLTGAMVDDIENPYMNEAMDIHFYMVNFYDSKSHFNASLLAKAISNILYGNLRIIPDSSLCLGMALEIIELV